MAKVEMICNVLNKLGKDSYYAQDFLNVAESGRFTEAQLKAYYDRLMAE